MGITQLLNVDVAQMWFNQFIPVYNLESWNLEFDKIPGW